MNLAIQFAELASPSVVCSELFQKKFDSAPPPDDWPHHLAAFWLENPGSLKLVTYVHFGRFGDTCLVGGMCTDGDVLRSMPQQLRDQLRSDGGVACGLLKFGFRRFEQDFDAFFGLVEDRRALQVDLDAGFQRTDHEKLVVYAPRSLPAANMKALEAKVLALGDF